ncbi:MAG: KTSC domain-containing protein [Taibaiella sp.]|nr:KTSC domain-containing protein [Taibaiella sp.]
MKKIIGYRKLMGVNEKATLQELKTVYRNLMKEWHPDKFADQEGKDLSEAKSRHIIEAYHFLVSIAPETKAQTLAAFTLTTTTVGITDFDYKDETLQINFVDGSSYEWFGVPKALYVKMVNAPAIGRFNRRHIYTSFPYRTVSKDVASME